MDLTTLVIVAGAGLSTSVGPCVAPRYLAMVGASARRDRATILRVLGVFVAGNVLGYWLVANVATVAARALSLSSYVYGVIAAVLIVSSLISLVRSGKHDCAPISSQRSLGGMFLLGLTTSLTVSPCCTPVLAALGVLAAREPLDATLEVFAYSAGHLVPIGLAAVAGGTLARLPHRFESAMVVLSAGITLALGCYYAVLA